MCLKLDEIEGRTDDKLFNDERIYLQIDKLMKLKDQVEDMGPPPNQ